LLLETNITANSCSVNKRCKLRVCILSSPNNSRIPNLRATSGPTNLATPDFPKLVSLNLRQVLTLSSWPRRQLPGFDEPKSERSQQRRYTQNAKWQQPIARPEPRQGRVTLTDCCRRPAIDIDKTHKSESVNRLCLGARGQVSNRQTLLVCKYEISTSGRQR